VGTINPWRVITTAGLFEVVSIYYPGIIASAKVIGFSELNVDWLTDIYCLTRQKPVHPSYF
jgi:hypothetical protein